MASPALGVYIGDRLRQFQAAAACLSVGPALRSGGLYCIFVGVIGMAILLALRVTAASPIFWAYLALSGLGVYLYLPDPQPWALLAGGLAILGVLAQGVYTEYDLWRRFHRVPSGGGIGGIIEIFLAIHLLASYASYKRHLAATDERTLAELREVALAVNKADVDQDAAIVELRRRNYRLRMRRWDKFVLVVTRRYIAFGIYSRLDGVAILNPQQISLAARGKAKPGRSLKLRVAGASKKAADFEIKPRYVDRIASLGVATAGIPPAGG